MENETQSKNKLAQLFEREAVLLLCVSIAAYIFAFSSQRAYLSSFGIDQTFVTVGLDSMVAFGVSSISFALIVYHLLSVPVGWVGWFLKIFLLFRLPFLMSAFSALFLLGSGVTWYFVTFFVLAVALFVFGLFILKDGISEAGGFEAYFAAEMERERKATDNYVLYKITDKIGGTAMIVALCSILFPYLFGEMVGARVARQKTEFLSVVTQDNAFLIVHEWKGVVISVGYSRADEAPLLNDAVHFFHLMT